jgi:hypothetical protein
MKMMLEHPANVRDLLSLLSVPRFDDINFSHIEYIKTTFIRRDYRHLASDIYRIRKTGDSEGQTGGQTGGPDSVVGKEVRQG